MTADGVTVPISWGGEPARNISLRARGREHGQAPRMCAREWQSNRNCTYSPERHESNGCTFHRRWRRGHSAPSLSSLSRAAIGGADGRVARRMRMRMRTCASHSRAGGRERNSCRSQRSHRPERAAGTPEFREIRQAEPESGIRNVTPSARATTPKRRTRRGGAELSESRGARAWSLSPGTPLRGACVGPAPVATFPRFPRRVRFHACGNI